MGESKIRRSSFDFRESPSKMNGGWISWSQNATHPLDEMGRIRFSTSHPRTAPPLRFDTAVGGEKLQQWRRPLPSRGSALPIPTAKPRRSASSPPPPPRASVAAAAITSASSSSAPPPWYETLASASARVSQDAYHLGTLHRIRDIWFTRPKLLKRYSLLETLEHAFSAPLPSCFSFFGGEESEFLDKGKLQSNTSRGNRLKGRLWTNALLVVNILAYVAQVATHGRLLLWGAKVNSLIDKGQIWRLITSSVLHANVAHLMINCYSLNSIGPVVEQLSGPRRFLAVYFTSALASSVMSYRLCKLPAVGASGAIFGLVGSYAVFVLRHRKLVGGGKQELQHIAHVITLNMVLGLLSRGIDNWGHWGGEVRRNGGSMMLLPSSIEEVNTRLGGGDEDDEAAAMSARMTKVTMTM